MEPAALVASTFAKQQWFWGAAVAIVTVLLLANAALFLVVYARRLREVVRARLQSGSSGSARRCWRS
jgi:hypothetical protein